MDITRLKLRHWRNFKSVDVELERRTFLVGPNASGKSNFLDAFRFLRDIASDGGGLASAVSSRGGMKEIRNFSATKNPNVSIECELGTNASPKQWSYKLEFASTKKGHTEIVAEAAWEGGVSVFSRPDPIDKSDRERLRQTALEQVNSNKAFRPIADFFRSVRYLHLVPQFVRDRTIVRPKEDPFGGDLISRINETAPRNRDARLKILGDALKICVPQLKDLKLEIDTKGIPHLRAKYTHWRPQGAWQDEKQFSDGTLRLLGLIWSLQETGGPILLEEPELSLHSSVVSKLAPLIAKATMRSRRQSLVTTHSSDILEDGVSLDQILLLMPGDQGTEIKRASELKEVRALVDGGVPAGAAVMPRSRPATVERLSQLDLFGP